jgi:hypothetical protein
MKPHPRIRKTIKWGGAAVTVLLVVVWVGSGWLSVRFTAHPRVPAVTLRPSGFGHSSGEIPSRFCGVGAGTVETGELFSQECTFYPEPGWTVHRREFTQAWGWGLDRSGSSWIAYFPLWWVVLPCVVCTVAAYLLDSLARRRARLNLCPKCRCNRTGLAASALCPECGAAAAAR